MGSIAKLDAVSTNPDDARYLAVDLMRKFAVSMALNAALQLRIPDILAKGEGRKLSAQDIVAELHKTTKSPSGKDLSSSAFIASKLTRLLRPLVQNGFFSLTDNAEADCGYGLTDMSKLFLSDNKLNFQPIAEVGLSPVLITSYFHLHKAILDDTVVPFEADHGLPLFKYMEKDHDYRGLYFDAFTRMAQREGSSLYDNLERYGVLKGVKTLVDVGGGTGATLAKIVAKNPQIHGINYDQPHVIAESPKFEGVEQVPGSFLESVPHRGDTHMIKFVIHNHNDEDSIKILKNCYEALPKSGKVVIVDYVMSHWQDQTPKAKMVDSLDLNMLVLFNGAQERTKEQFEHILAAAGFARSNVIQVPGSVDFIEGFKE